MSNFKVYECLINLYNNVLNILMYHLDKIQNNLMNIIYQIIIFEHYNKCFTMQFLFV
jgi:hypothetical protein